jgi:sugar lactone lactonase YvrE
MRTQHDGTIAILASHYNGKELNSPNDIVVHGSGAIYFTDRCRAAPQPTGWSDHNSYRFKVCIGWNQQKER